MAQKIFVDRDYLTTELAKKANTSHASSSTTYGASSASNYGHAKASSTTPKANGTAAVGSETSSFARGDHVHPAQTTITGNAGSATKVNKNLAIKLNGGSTEGTNLFTFNGSAAKTVNITPSGIGALALTGGTLTGKLKINGPASDQPLQVRGIVGSSADSSSVDGLYLQYGANKEVYFGNSGGYTISADGSNYTGNAATATTLKTARTINGTSFNGSANITTSKWGTARNLTIGNKTQSVNGSANITYSLADIGAVSQTDFDNLTIGGRNYVLDSKKETTTTSTYQTRNLSGDAAADLAGKVVTFSFDLKGTTAGGNIYVYFRSSSGSISPASQTIGAATTEYKRYSITFTAPADLSTAVTAAVHTTSAIGTASLKNFKVELGHKATSWCPAVEDALVLGETSTTAYRGDRGKTAYNHSQAAHAPSNAQKNSDITKAEIEAKLTGAITSHTHSYLPLTGGSVSGAITKTGGSGAGFVVANGTSRTMVFSSQNLGEHIFGGSNDSSNQVTDFLRVGVNKLTYETGGNVYNIYHAGNKPSASVIGAAPTNHASTATTYGVSSASNYGHAMASGTTPKANGTAAVGSETAKFARGDHVHPLQTSVSGSSGSCTGNAATATKLKTARTLTIGDRGETFDGSANVTWTHAEMGVARGNTVSATTAATAQWYRIAQTASDIANNMATFNIQANVSSYHTSTLLAAGISYGKNPTLIQLAHTNYGAGITKARIVYHTTYSGNKAYLEVYLSQAKAATITVDMQGKHGWTLVAPSTVGSIPSGYTSKEISLTVDKMVGNFKGTGEFSSLAMSGSITLNNNNVIRAKTAAAYTNTNTSESIASGSTINLLQYNSSGNLHLGSGMYDNYLNTGSTYINSSNNVVYRTRNTGYHQFQVNETAIVNIKSTEVEAAKNIYAKAGIKSGGNVVSDTALTDDLGTSAIPWKTMFIRAIGLRSDTTGTSTGSFEMETAGTTSVQGISRLILGNNTAAGKATNAKGYIRMYGTSSGYTDINVGNNTTSNISLTLPSAGGTLARTADIDSKVAGYLPLSGGTLTNGNFGALTIKRSGSTNGASIKFENSSGDLGYIGMRGAANEGLVRWTADTNTMYTILDTGNFKTHVTPSAIGASASGHTHSYLPLAGGTMTGNITLNNNISIKSKTPAAYTNTSTSASVASGSSVNILTYNSSGNCHVNAGPYDNYLSTGSLYLNSPNNLYLRTVNSGGHYMQINGSTVAHFKNDETAFTKITYTKAGIKSGGNIVSDTAVTDNLGTAAIPWKTAYAKQIYVYGEANKRYGYISTPTVGTTSTVGECLLVVGNDTASGTAGNAKGRVFLYGTNTGGTYIATANDTTSNYTITLPAKSGTVACTSDYVKSKKLTQSEYNSATKNSSTLYIIVG